MVVPFLRVNGAAVERLFEQAPELAEEAEEGEVVVSGRINHLAVTNRERAASFLTEELLSDEEQHELADLEL